MRYDIIDLREFYGRHLGQVVERTIRTQVRAMWPDLRGMTVLGMGYAIPAVGPLQSDAERVINFMPAQQGVSRWPVAMPNVTALVEEHSLPLPDASVDRVVLMHGLETAETVRPLLRELWRILSGPGRLLVITPNRRGLWARAEATPFGQGHPYSRGQLIQLMRDNQFDPQAWHEALFLPPIDAAFVLRTAAIWERFGPRIWPRFPGLHLVEVSKQIYAMPRERKPLRVLRPVPVTQTGLVGSARNKEIVINSGSR